ncbi:MAG: Zn-dependent protease [Halobacteriovoraceae bacterium]|nr:Zn-dependent protease [Halobacteriovoraceae bacterium]
MENYFKKETFYNIGQDLFKGLEKGEDLTIALSGEETTYIRFNGAKVRQALNVVQGDLIMTLNSKNRTSSLRVGFADGKDQNSFESNLKSLKEALKELRAETSTLPEDPYLVPTENHGQYEREHEGSLPSASQLMEDILGPNQGIDLVGVYSGGRLLRANLNSKGQKQWFSTINFLVDFSLYDSAQNAVKEQYGGSHWDQKSFLQQIKLAKKQLELMAKPKVKVPRGHYKTYFGPAAVHEILGMMSWGAVSGSSWKKGESALGLLANEEKKLSPQFSLQENFELGLCPPFNERGEISKEKLSIITNGRLETFLINSKTAQEYNLEANGAGQYEGLRSPSILPGNLKEEDILKNIGTGLYLSNLHYLNWSDQRGGRMTGMTRFACFWVENGEMVAPIEDLRFDESLYRFFGENLIDLTQFTETFPEPGSYHRKGIGGSKVPGMIVKDFAFTL